MKHVIVLVTFFIASISLAQTNGVLSGKILDAEMYNEPLLMASVSIKNTSWKAQTNFNGNFEITAITPGNYIVQISFLGYDSVEMPIEIKEGERLEVLESLYVKSLPMLPMATTAEKNTTTASTEIRGFKK
ncbi:carboxypeptidase-like regulatory domain-containing protein [Maribacter sp. R77961]|jgi:hypothetical protein|uniref:carboxypeptidase-like regulatory domain-containing protein n=1 Tax=Maribacter sp. R77961 TaxID=3093871 RepID=UPI0037CAFEAD